VGLGLNCGGIMWNRCDEVGMSLLDVTPRHRDHALVEFQAAENPRPKLHEKVRKTRSSDPIPSPSSLGAAAAARSRPPFSSPQIKFLLRFMHTSRYGVSK
jgi:hypothetical protein